MEAIAMGPTTANVHSPNERLRVKSVETTWKFLLNILKKLVQETNSQLSDDQTFDCANSFYTPVMLFISGCFACEEKCIINAEQVIPVNQCIDIDHSRKCIPIKLFLLNLPIETYDINSIIYSQVSEFNLYSEHSKFLFLKA